MAIDRDITIGESLFYSPPVKKTALNFPFLDKTY